MCLPLKTIPGKIKNGYQTYCTVYKTYAIAICNGGAGHPIARDNLHVKVKVLILYSTARLDSFSSALQPYPWQGTHPILA